MIQSYQDLRYLPPQCRFTPCNGKKAPYLQDWTNKPLSFEELEHYIREPRCKSIGLLLGEVSGGIMALDRDGESCDRLIEQLSGLTLEEALPKTLTVTSGKHGRCQKFYRMPQEYWLLIGKKVIKTGVKDSNGKNEQLEFRWTGHQSILIGKHPETGSYKWVEGCSPAEVGIAIAPDWIIEQMRLSQPHQSTNGSRNNRDIARTETNSSPASQSSDSGCVKLQDWLSAKNRQLLREGMEDGDRNNSAFRLAADLIGAATIIKERKVELDADAASLFNDFCDRCRPPIPEKERANIWKSASAREPLPSIPGETLERKVEELLELQEECSEIERLIDSTNKPKTYLIESKWLEPIKAIADRMNLPYEAYVTSLLCTAASVLKTGTYLEIDPATDFKVPAILWMGLVGESGSKKSPILKAITKPLEQLQEEADKEYQRRYEDYELECEQWLAGDKGSRGSKPKPPLQIEYYQRDFTLESLSQYIHNQKDRGILVDCDELARFFNLMDAYRLGRGGDRQQWLIFYDGGAMKVTRKGSGRLYAPRTSISILGSIQPSILAKIINKDDLAEDGLWSRFSWVIIPMTITPGVIPDSPRSNLTEVLGSLYRHLGSIPPQIYKLAPEATDIWNEWHLEIERTIVAEPCNLLRATYPKARERAARIALIVHLINSPSPSPYISAHTMSEAIAYSKWLMGQCELLYAELGLSKSREMSRILNFARKFKGVERIKARDVARWWSAKVKPLAEECRQFMYEVVKLGLAEEINSTPEESDYQIRIKGFGSDSSDKVAETATGKAFGLSLNGSDKLSDNADNFKHYPTNTQDAGEGSPKSDNTLDGDLSLLSLDVSLCCSDKVEPIQGEHSSQVVTTVTKDPIDSELDSAIALLEFAESKEKLQKILTYGIPRELLRKAWNFTTDEARRRNRNWCKELGITREVTDLNRHQKDK